MTAPLIYARVIPLRIAETRWLELSPEEDWITFCDEDQHRSEVGKLEQELVRRGDAILRQAQRGTHALPAFT